MANTILSTLAIFISVFVFLVQMDIIQIKPKNKDKYDAYRDPQTKLLRGRKE